MYFEIKCFDLIHVLPSSFQGFSTMMNLKMSEKRFSSRRMRKPAISMFFTVSRLMLAPVMRTNSGLSKSRSTPEILWGEHAPGNRLFPWASRPFQVP